MKKNKFYPIFWRLIYLLLFLATLFGLLFIFLFSNNSRNNTRNNLNQINHDLVVNKPEPVGQIRSNFDHNFSYLLLNDGGYIVANANDSGISRIDNFGNVLWKYISKPDNLDFRIVSVIQNPDVLNEFYVLSIPTTAPVDQYNFNSNFWARLSVIDEDLSSNNESVLKISKKILISPEAMIQNIPSSWITGNPAFLSGTDLVKPDGSFGYSYDLYIANMGNMLYFKNKIFLFGTNGFNNSYSLGVYRIDLDSTLSEIHAWPYASLIQNWRNVKSPTDKVWNSDFPIFQDDNFTYAFRGAIAGISTSDVDPGLVTIAGIFTIGSENIWNSGEPHPTTSNQNISNSSAIIGFFKLSLFILSQNDFSLKSASDSNWYNFGVDSFVNTKNEIANVVKANIGGNFSILNVADFKQISNKRYVMQFMNSILLIDDNHPYNLYKFISYALLSDYNNWNYFVNLLFISNSNNILAIWNDPNKFSNNTTLYLFDLNKLDLESDQMIQKNNDLDLKIVSTVLASPLDDQFYIQGGKDTSDLFGINLVLIKNNSEGNISFNLEDFTNSSSIRNAYLGYGEIKRPLSPDILKLPVFQIIETVNNISKIRDVYITSFIKYSLPNKEYNASPKIFLKVKDSSNSSISFESFVLNPLTNSYSRIPGLYSIYKFTGFNTTPAYVLIILISVFTSVIALIIITCFIVGMYKRRKRILTKQKLSSKYKDISD